jgi:hypothetical protein
MDGDSVNLRALVHQTAEAYLGHTETLDELVTGITDLAHDDPGRARQLVESIAAAAEDATRGRHTEELDCVEQFALKTLGLHAEAVVNRPGRDTREEKQQEK